MLKFLIGFHGFFTVFSRVFHGRFTHFSRSGFGLVFFETLESGMYLYYFMLVLIGLDNAL